MNAIPLLRLKGPLRGIIYMLAAQSEKDLPPEVEVTPSACVGSVVASQLTTLLAWCKVEMLSEPSSTEPLGLMTQSLPVRTQLVHGLCSS